MSPRMLARVLLLPFVLLFASTWCGCSASQRERTIKTTLAAVNEARAAFVTLDNGAQQAIVAIAPSYEQGLAALLVYRKRREVVVEAFAAAYRAIALAATTNDADAIPAMITAARYAAGALNTLKETEQSP